MARGTSNSSNSRNPWTHFDSKLWISIGLVITLGQIIAAIVVLSVSGDEKPHTPLFAWVLVYMFGCVATLPLIYWNGQMATVFNASILMDFFAIPLACLFDAWFVVGCVWIRHASSSDAPNLYWLSVVFLTISCCLWFAIPLILLGVLCYYLILMIIDFRQNPRCVKGASPESINALQIRNYNSNNAEISGEAEVCCICLTKYVDGDKLRELPCFHFFHTKCVDKWLKRNASCPLCKKEIAPR